VICVVIAVRARKHDHAKFHRECSPLPRILTHDAEIFLRLGGTNRRFGIRDWVG
jgi:hypothetical protein